MPANAFIVGTRKSQLAVTQTNQVINVLKRLFPNLVFEIKTISTAGDRVPDRTALPTHQGIFVKELEEALLRKEIDLAVHSLKDMPCDITDGLELGAVCTRANPQDALLSRGHIKFKNLKAGARIGTSSIRRRAQVMLARPDLAVADLRGNVDTRIRKLNDEEVDAIIIAAAGIKRLGLENLITELMPFDIMLPAPCQGALAIEIRKGDQRLKDIVYKLDDFATRSSIVAERAFLRGLGGGCSLPVGALGQVTAEDLTLNVQVVSPDGTKTVRRSVGGSIVNADKIGRDLARELLETEGEWLQRALRIKI
ncbi:MAG: hydroxymethylbilane synthase [Candidatus Omnitrophica bacterium]|nr:hydroxymethylbilane synthase [Candidatus Omnitrophota bacterium]